MRRWQLRARGNVVYVTDYEILKKRQDRGWPTPRLGQGSNPDLWWRLSRALKSRQGTFTVQWQRPHVAAADIKHGNHDMALVFGNEMADAVAKQAARKAALRGAAAEQMTWVDALAWSDCGLSRQIHRLQKTTPTVLVSGGNSAKHFGNLFWNRLHINWHFGDQGKGENVKFASRAQAKRRQYAG